MGKKVEQDESSGLITAVVVFFISYIYCISTYGYLFGLGLGWLPSLIVAAISYAMWPLVWLGGAIFLLVILLT